MASGSNFLSNSIKVMRGVNERDNQTMSKLVVQTESITNAKENLNNVESILGRSEKIVRRLLRRVQTNKLLLITIIVLLTLTIILVIYMKLKRIFN